jgi:uncharacterized membrane protein YeaQ/YmgE (transglycosylase-associated protein family)
MILTWTNIFILLVIGGLAGWVAGLIWKGSGFGLPWNILIGIAGAFLGGWVFNLLEIAHYGIIGWFIAALVGALILLAIVNLIRRRR